MRRSLPFPAFSLLVVLLAACGPPGDVAAVSPVGGDWISGNTAFDDRAAAVADQWRASASAEQWSKGYLPLQEPTVLVGDPEFTDATKQAFLNGWYHGSITLSRSRPPDGTVRFPDGTLAVPLISADEAYRELDQGDPPSCSSSPRVPLPPVPPDGPSPVPTARDMPAYDPNAPTQVAPAGDGPSRDPLSDVVATAPPVTCAALTVTKATLGTATVWTSRGEAVVPAWLFTVKELKAQVARVAVAPSAVTELPSVPEPEHELGPQHGLVSSQDLSVVEGTKLGFRLGVGACDHDITPLVREFDDVVVVGGSVRRSDGPCTMQLILHPVEVTLHHPVGTRPVLDVLSGQPLRIVPSAR